jgi:hypothetical protein
MAVESKLLWSYFGQAERLDSTKLMSSRWIRAGRKSYRPDLRMADDSDLRAVLELLYGEGHGFSRAARAATGFRLSR